MCEGTGACMQVCLCEGVHMNIGMLCILNAGVYRCEFMRMCPSICEFRCECTYVPLGHMCPEMTG